jgi:hypothetical protein
MSVESKNLTKFKASKLMQGEEVVYSVDGYIGDMMGSKDRMQINGELILTNRRVTFFSASGFLSSEAYESFQLDNINSVDTAKTDVISIFNFVKVFTSGGLVLTFKTQPTKAIAIHGKILEALHNRPSVIKTVTNTASMVDELKKLSELKAAGVLTDEEFTQAKAKLIAG